MNSQNEQREAVPVEPFLFVLHVSPLATQVRSREICRVFVTAYRISWLIWPPFLGLQ